METALAAAQATPSPLAALVSSAPVLTALEADFKRNRWTFTLPPQPVGPGAYLVLRADEARFALDVEPAALTTLNTPRNVRVEVEDRCRIGVGYGSLTLSVKDDDGFDCTLWYEHGPFDDEGKRYRRPGTWSGSIQHRGSDGAMWRRSVTMVCDEFGNLVDADV